MLLHNQDLVTETKVINCPFSDHSFIAAKINLNQIREKKNTFKGRLLSEKKVDEIVKLLEKTDFSFDSSASDVNDILKNLKSKILNAIDKVSPVK